MKIKPQFKYEETKTLLLICSLAVFLAWINVSFNHYHGIVLKFTISLGFAAILLFVLKNTALSFLLALAMSCVCFAEVPSSQFFEFIRGQLGYTILAILVIGGFMNMLIQSGGSEQLNIFIRKLCKTLNNRKLAGIGITALNCFSSTATVAAIHLLFKEDLESKITSQQDKHDLIRIMVMFSNLSCTLIPISLWWLFFKSFTGVSIEYLDILPYLFYPFTVIVYWLFIILWAGNSFKQRQLPDYGNQRVQAREIILEQRQLDKFAS